MARFYLIETSSIVDTRESSVTFHGLNNFSNLLPSIIYQFSLSTTTKKLTLNVESQASEESINWLKFVLFKKLQNWMESCENEDSEERIESHQLINSEVYNEKYAELKEKHGKKLEENWNESTDPKKFIYEDIAIASYLIVLWNQEAQETGTKQSFVDLGCGNGLLVYILTQEGHRGYGIDLRKRKIWDQFPAKVDLREMAIVPSDENLFSDVDWIIGNHSDELSPWIPVISARSSFSSKYFLLPCCAFEFSGAKYQRKGSKSQYLSFVDYLLTVSNACGFADTRMDRLKIPSTKRICLIGSARNYNESQFKLVCQEIQAFINDSNTQDGSSEKWSVTFKPREKVETVKNCSKVDKNLCDSIVKMIFERLLTKKETYCDNYPGWNCGGEMTIPEAVQLVSQENLKKLKTECGGLQTLLRNKHQVFHVHSGSVRIRIPKKLQEKKFSDKSMRRNVIKTSPCYFFHNHKSSCPLDNNDCSFIH